MIWNLVFFFFPAVEGVGYTYFNVGHDILVSDVPVTRNIGDLL